MVDSLKVKVPFTPSMFESRGLLKLGILYGWDWTLSSLWSILASKLAVFGRLDSVSEISTDANVAMRPNSLGMPFIFLYIS